MPSNWPLTLSNQALATRSRVGDLPRGEHLGPSDINIYLSRQLGPDVLDWRDDHVGACDTCLSETAAAATLRLLARSLEDFPQWPRIGLSTARGATPYLQDGQTPDGQLRWTANEDPYGNCVVQIATDAGELEGRRVRIEARRVDVENPKMAVLWSADCFLQARPTGAGCVQLGAEGVIPTNERRRFQQDAVVRLTLIESVAWHSDVTTIAAELEKLSGEWHSRAIALIRKKVYGISADIADDLLQEFIAERLVAIARTYNPTRPFWPFVRTALWNFCNARGKRLHKEAVTQRPLDEVMESGWEPSAPGTSVPGHDADVREALVKRLVEALPPRERSLVGLRYAEDLTTPEIAAVTHWAEGAIKPWIMWALRAIEIAVRLECRQDVRAALSTIVHTKGRIHIFPVVLDRLADLLESTDPELVRATLRAVGILGKKARTRRIVERCRSLCQRADDTASAKDLCAAAGACLANMDESAALNGTTASNINGRGRGETQ